MKGIKKDKDWSGRIKNIKERTEKTGKTANKKQDKEDQNVNRR
jgi:hypothetical protein